MGDKSKISVDRDALLAAVKTVGAVVEARNTIPVLSNLLLRLVGGELQLAGTDLDVLCEARCSATGDDFELTLPFGALEKSLASLRAGRVEIEIAAGSASLVQGRSRRKLPSMPASDFPYLRMDEGSVEFEISTGALQRMLAACAGSQSTEEVRYYLNGIYLHHRDGALVGVATDGFTLARCVIDKAAKTAKMPSVIIGRKMTGLLLRLLAKAPEIVTLRVGEKKVEAVVGGVVIVAKNVEGTFPDYTRVIPVPTDDALVATSEEMVRAIGAVAAAGTLDGKAVRIVRFNLDAGEALQMQARDSNGFEAIEPIDGRYGGAAKQVGANGSYATTVARMFAEASTLTMAFGEPNSAILIRSDDEPDLTAVLMPHRI